MASIPQNWRQSSKHISEYKFTKLPAGDEKSHEDFKVAQYKKKAGQHNKSEQKKIDEANEDLKRKEQKILNEQVGVIDEL